MIGFYVLMVAALVLAGAVGYTLLSSVQTANALSLAERNAARLEMTASALRQVVIADAEGRFFVPMGVPSFPSSLTSRTSLPDWVSGERVTPWGTPYGYCPYAPVTAPGGSSATVYGGANYAVSLTSDPVVYGAARPYVISGARPSNPLDAPDAPTVLAFLISPSNNASAVPACNNVYWDGRAWLTTGPVTGSVRAVTVDALSDSLAQAPRVLRRHAAQGASGSGLSASDPAALSTVLTEWRYLRPHRLTVVLDDAGGPFLISPTATDLGAGAGGTSPHPDAFGRHLILEAATGDSPVINTYPSDAAGVLRFPADTTIDGVSFGTGLGVSGMAGSRLLIRDSQLPSLATGGGEVILASGVSVTAPSGASSPPVLVNGGSLSVQGPVSIDGSEPGGAGIRQRGGLIQVAAPLSVTTGIGSSVFDALSYGEVSQDAGGALTLTGLGDQNLEAYTREIEVLSSGCVTGDLTCSVTCPDERPPLSGTCTTSGVTNVFLRGTQISGSVFSCAWSQVSELADEVTDPAGPVSPVARAICGPKR
ncbi:hypothetical protein IQ03_01193 [Gemmobacter caeni]|uniref:Uncharacterized protein n=1 Tax=Gemmobacter caeni TaxID=589035 RepID=A0A2T6B916_9RHOB|nr:hypothetical protein [Gemmobacter caeni]PTX52554.1 hypothetical protein C8N34_102334 [Gemmobacter caeni]TWJ02775.1 hypothetical protein IQ03_01193 [Gemmobacter caeni]